MKALPITVALLVLAGCGGIPRPAADPAPTAPAASGPAPTPTPSPAPTPSSLVPPGLEDAARAMPVEGGDVSWPQCPKGMGIPQKQGKGLAMPLPSARFVVLGLTNSPGFTENPCLADQVSWVEQRRLMASAYSVVSYPDDATLRREGDRGPYEGGSPLDRLGNVGYQQAVFNIATMKRAGLVTPTVWVDVEPVSLFEWSADPQANAAVVKGAVRGYQDAGYRVGAYSTQHLWRRVVGNLRLGLPEWRAAGLTSRAEALRRCGEERMFQGGTSVMSQWVDGSAESGRDRNVTCPGVSANLGAWFHQY